MKDLRIYKITDKNRQQYTEQLSDLEKLASYPLGNDFFKIDHGQDYFRFFERMGKMYYYVACHQDKVIAAVCGILRRVPWHQGKKTRRCWYLCDLKVHPDYRQRRIPSKMLRKIFFANYIRCPRGYAISMNPATGENRVVRLFKKWNWFPISSCSQLQIYSLDYHAIEQMRPLLETSCGKLSFLSHSGVKDIVIQSTQAAMPLLHAQFGDTSSKTFDKAQPGHTHMFCLCAQDALSKRLRAEGLVPDSTATIVNIGIKSDWRFVLTSDI